MDETRGIYAGTWPKSWRGASNQWQSAVEKLGFELTGEASLQCMEPNIAVTLKAMILGAVEMEVQITPNQLTQDHKFRFEIDQSYLQPLSSQYAHVLHALPLRGA